MQNKKQDKQKPLFAQIKEIKKSNPQNLMARYFSEEYFLSLSEVKQNQLKKIIASGLENPNSQMGIYANETKDYDDFAQYFDLIIKDYHVIAPDIKIEQKHNWDIEETSYNLKKIDEKLAHISMRVRVGRNLSDFPLPANMIKQQRLELEEIAINAFKKLMKNKNFGGQYLSLSPNSSFKINDDEYQNRINKHQMFKDMSQDKYLNVAGISNDWPFGRGIYISQNEDFLIWVNEEDHFRIMVMKKNGNLGAMFKKLNEFIDIFSQHLPPFASSKKYGFLASCPSNIGTSMRASLHIKLPLLTQNGNDLIKLTNEAKKLGLAVRGVGGEHSKAGKDGLVDISPTARLNISEKQIMEQLFNGVKTLWHLESVNKS